MSTLFDSYKSPRFNRNDLATSLNTLADRQVFHGGTSGGSANAQTITLTGVTSYYNGLTICFIAGFTNTAKNPTLNVNSLGAVVLLDDSGLVLNISDIPNGRLITVIYHNSNFVVIGGKRTHGLYTPTATNVSNVASAGTYPCMFSIVGNHVFVSGKADIDVTSANTYTQLRLSLPIVSNLGIDYDLSGSLTIESVSTSFTLPIRADTANDNAVVAGFWGNVTANSATFFNFNYRVL